ncbi:MAG: hypothetical protein SF339_25300, partial [Blastocatellia bacterium]|nr:hypothetical protein [Blastocatellia bacterium]
RTHHYWIRALARLPVKRAITGLGHFTQPDQPGFAWRTEDAKAQRRVISWFSSSSRSFFTPLATRLAGFLNRKQRREEGLLLSTSRFRVFA